AGRLAEGSPIEIFGDGRQTRDFIFVGDVVAHLLAAMERPQTGSHVLNVCTGNATSILELAQTMAQVMGATPRIRYLAERPGDIAASLGDPGAARATLGAIPIVSLAVGLQRTLHEVAPVPFARFQS